MNLKRKYINWIVLSLILFPLIALSQSGDNQVKRMNVPDISGFKAWLTHSWLRNDINYDTIEIENGKIFLTLRLNCSEDCTSKWNRMKSAFDSLSSMDFEEYIWNKADFHLEISNTNLIVEIYNRPKPFEAPCFLRSIYYQDTLRVEKADCKDLGGESALNYDKFNPSFLMKKLTISGIDKRANQIIDTLYSKCEKYFKSKGRDVEVIKSKVSSHRIVFEVNNLKNEVIKGPGTVEKIQITIICNFHSQNVGFETIMNGKYGSIRLKPVSDKGYNDMEDDYKPEFQTYVNDFTNNKLLQWLK